ncbi:hypothetical protein [Extibacter muris]|uniref:DUF4365 domain-containing protein n=1 Tax=Extibacter muris TaxID=1796622 RepID=A0A4R4F8Y0_9FIRM|nr:hypothetical protein [Extibacter muris]MCU0081535.1 hypothetical protein [Extibacter muris]TDA20077.1 hypothetical protein E1963_19055 [Extibacter muris]
MDIENLGTSAVIDAIARTDFLSPFVKSGDKEPSWDGHIYAFSHKSKKNEYYKGRAPVQIKGKLCKKFSEDEFRYPVRAVDLHSYRKEGGTIYFVVQINIDGTCKKIYYNALLPYTINQLLENDENNGKLSVTMYEFPTEKNEITNIVLDFIRDKDRQDLLKCGKNVSIDSVVQGIGLENLSFGFAYTGLGYDYNKPYEYLFNHDTYLYAEQKELNYQVPICHMWRVNAAKTELKIPVCVNGKEYFKSCEIVHRPDRNEIHFGKSIVFKEPHIGNPSMLFSLKGNIDERISAIEFLLAMVENQEIVVDGTSIKTEFYAQEIKKFGIKEKEEQLQHLKIVKEVLESLDVQVPLEYDNITGKDEIYIKMLVQGIRYGDLISFKDEKVPAIGHIPIANLNIMLHFIESADGKYKIENFADDIADCRSEYADGTFFDTSKYTILQTDDFIKISNLRFDKMEQELFSIENMGHFWRVNLMLLEMIKAYDKTKRDVLIYSAIRIGIWLLEKYDDMDMVILNVYQCYYRIRRLSDEELDILEEIAQRRRDNLSIILGAYILLENNRKTKKIWKVMDREAKKEFIKFPIYHIWMNREDESV